VRCTFADFRRIFRAVRVPVRAVTVTVTVIVIVIVIVLPVAVPCMRVLRL
jgi:hypothetical protein